MISVYIIGVIIATVLGWLEYKYEEIHINSPISYDMLFPVAMLSWISVFYLLMYRRKEIRWAIWYIFGL